MTIRSKDETQRRADRMGAFQAELEALEKDAVLSLDAHQRAAVADCHGRLLAHLSSAFDIDADRREKQLSLGMKIASF